ncbi:MAG: MBL fold metallo-hydrolase [Lachnospiraceae bacterium]|nr:MBL fold metallo-hydrolase [Lachnospiraceae bacterium]
MKQTVMYQITETSPFMMSFVIITKEDNVIIVDGGRAEDMDLLKQYVGGRHISAWILTHAHGDHISGFVAEFQKNGGADFDIEKIYYNFPPFEIIHNHDVYNYDYFKSELLGILPAFNEVLPLFEDKVHITQQGESVYIDEVRIDFLYAYHSYLTNNLMNDSSLVFKLSTPEKSVLFLGDLGPEGGDVLYRESRHLLKADMVQMAHHGHMNCGMEVYAAIAPEICLWCCPDWLYNEPEIPHYQADYDEARRVRRDRMYGTSMTRKWMEQLGAKKHYVTKDGTNKIIL